MKTIKLIAWSIGITTLSTMAAVSRPVVTVQVGTPVVVAPAPVVVSPAPAVSVVVGVPDYYVWDGVEFVGVIGTQYCYLGPGNIWVACDPVRIARFHTWETHHVGWRTHAILNVKYRKDAHGHPVPLKVDPHADKGFHHGNDKDHDHDHGHGH